MAAAAHRVGRADGLELAHQCGQVIVGEREQVAVQHRVAEAGHHQCIAKLRDLHEVADVRGVIGVGESLAQFHQRVRAEGGTHQQATGLEHAAETGKHRR
ncbi:hypothetical protein D3C71_1425740 [compost metagenome]